MKVKVKLVRQWKKYKPGDVLLLDIDTSRKLVRGGFGFYLSEVPLTRREMALNRERA